jgi:GATA-binding protein
MKKGEIKRRKRVMPAMPNQAPQQAGSGFESSVSPDPNQSGHTEGQMQATTYQQDQQMSLPHHDRSRNNQEHTEHLLEPPTQSYGPPPVDFTSYSTTASSSSNTHRSPSGTNYPSHTTDPKVSRKRTLSAAERHTPGTMPPPEDRGNNRSPTTAHHHHVESTNRSSAVTDPAIDPSLSSFTGRPVAQTPSPTIINGAGPAGETKEEKKTRLIRQREALRQSLLAMESELEQMDEEEG